MAWRLTKADRADVANSFARFLREAFEGVNDPLRAKSVEIGKLKAILGVHLEMKDAQAANDRDRLQNLVRKFGFSINELEDLARLYAKRVALGSQQSENLVQSGRSHERKMRDYAALSGHHAMDARRRPKA